MERERERERESERERRRNAHNRKIKNRRVVDRCGRAQKGNSGMGGLQAKCTLIHVSVCVYV